MNLITLITIIIVMVSEHMCVIGCVYPVCQDRLCRQAFHGWLNLIDLITVSIVTVCDHMCCVIGCRSIICNFDHFMVG